MHTGDNPLRRPSRDHPHRLPPLPSLLTLRLRNVSLSALTAWTFQRMPRLRALDVSHNRLLYLPQGIFQGINHLRSVRLANCSLRLINAKALILPRLEELDLTGNHLQAIAPISLAQLPSLRSLQLADNRLEVLQRYALPSLLLLSAPRNRLRVLKANSFIHMQTLQVLPDIFPEHFLSAYCHCFPSVSASNQRAQSQHLSMRPSLMRLPSLLPSLLLISAVTEKCRVDYVERSPSCDTKKLGMEKYAIGALHYLTPMEIEVQKNGVINVSTPQWQFEEEFWAGGIYVRVPPYIKMTCSKDTQDFPNACSGKLTVQYLKKDLTVNIFPDEYQPNMLPSESVQVKYFTYGMALYFYSSYNEKDGKIQERIEAKYALDTDGICSVDVEYVHGPCFGLGSDPRAPESPPPAPVVEGASPSFPVVDAKQPPPPQAPKRGGWIWPFLAILLVILALLGAGLFFMRRQRLVEEERALQEGQVS
eukprot:s5357_g4.t1